MKIAKDGKVAFCCGGLSWFFGSYECIAQPWDGEEPLRVELGTTSGTRETAFRWCPFCGVKIEIEEEG